jgi:CIC family chloride channel protein
MPESLGVGYETITTTLHGGFALKVLVGLFFVKLASSCLTLGSGGSGGIFAPSLVLGAVLGNGFGDLVHGMLPHATAHPGVYGVVGMAALVAGTTHAPISAILILFEMTRDFALVLPLMIACVISSTAARGILHESIYTLKLARRGIRLRGGRDAAVLTSITVAETMRRPVLIPASLPFEQVRTRLLAEPYHLFPVVGENDELRGVIALDELRPFLMEEGLRDVAVAQDLAASCDGVLSPDDDLQDAREALLSSPHDELPVVDPKTNKVVGVLRERDLHAAYNRALAYLE